MGLLYEKIQAGAVGTSDTDGFEGGSLYEKIQQQAQGKVPNPGAPEPLDEEQLPEQTEEEADEEPSFLQQQVRNVTDPDFPVKETIKGLPGAAKDVGGAFVNTFIPAIKNFTQTTGSIIGEGIAYAVDENVREQYEAGNLDILPTVTETTQADLAKYTIAAGLEAAVYRIIPGVAKASLVKRGGLGALQGIGFAISEGLANDEEPEEIIAKMPLYGVSGAALEVVAPHLLPLLKAETKNVPRELRSVFKSLQKEISPPKPTSVGVTGQASAPVKVPVRTPNTQYEAYLRSQGYEPYIPDEQLPIVDLGKRRASQAAGDLPTIDVGPVERTPFGADNKPPTGTRLTPLEDGPVTAPKRQPTPAAPAAAQAPAEPIERTTTKVSRDQLPVAGDEGTKKVSRLEARVKGILDDPVAAQRAEMDGLSTFQAMNKTEQIAKASKYVVDNPEEAMAVLRGEKPAPEGLLHNSIALALERSAVDAVDADMAIKLASLRSTRAGQEISMLTEADPVDPISHIHQIIKARTDRAARRLPRGETTAKAQKKAVKEAAEEVDKLKLKINEARSLLDEIVC